DNVFDPFFSVAEQHVAVVAEEQGVLHSGVAGGHGAFEHDDVAGFPHVQHRHSRDRAGGVFGRGGVDRVVGADHQDYRGFVEVVVDLVHFQDDVVGHLGFGQQDVHVSGQTSGHRMHAE